MRCTALRGNGSLMEVAVNSIMTQLAWLRSLGRRGRPLGGWGRNRGWGPNSGVGRDGFLGWVLRERWFR
jgi:hypothetical protein